MASLSNDPGGRRRILFTGSDGKRKPIRLGKMPLKQAQIIQRHIERLIACRIDSSAPPEETSRWLVGVDPSLREKLTRYGLVAPERKKESTLGELIETFKNRPHWHTLKPSTLKHFRRAFSLLKDYFGESCLLRNITTAGTGDFHAMLGLPTDKGGYAYAPATCNLVASKAHTLFEYAIDAEILNRNPFRSVPRGSKKGKNVFVSRPDSLLVMEGMRTCERKLLFALARWGGLRMPSEPLGLRWCDIDWERGRFLVHSPKTERYDDHKSRWVPIFPELAPLLDERFSEAAEGDEYVLPSIRTGQDTTATNLLETALRRSGVERWPRLWHSLRSTRETELANEFPSHVVCAWLGNSQNVARKHYLQVTDDHFRQAAQNAAQQVTESSATKRKCPSEAREKTA